MAGVLKCLEHWLAQIAREPTERERTALNAPCPSLASPSTVRSCRRTRCRNRLLPISGMNLDTPSFRFFGHRDRQMKDPVLIRRRHLLGVQALAQEELSGESSLRPLAHHRVDSLALPVTLRLDCEHVLLNGHFDRLGLHTRKVEIDMEHIPDTVSVKRHCPSSPAVEELSRKLVKLTEGIESHQHGAPPPSTRHLLFVFTSPQHRSGQLDFRRTTLMTHGPRSPSPRPPQHFLGPGRAPCTDLPGGPDLGQSSPVADRLPSQTPSTFQPAEHPVAGALPSQCPPRPSGAGRRPRPVLWRSVAPGPRLPVVR